jgi:hypothetical protein
MRRALGIEEVGIKALPLPAEELARYEGTYDLGTLELRIFAEGGRLRAQGTNQPVLDLLYQGDHTFVAEADHGIRMVFQLDGARASGFTLYQGGAEIPAPRLR